MQLFLDGSLTDAEMRNRIQHIHRESTDLSSLMKNQSKIDVIAFPTPYCMCSGGRSSNVSASN